jgi:membrane-bound inhibitor of C-type lysozyme
MVELTANNILQELQKALAEKNHLKIQKCMAFYSIQSYIFWTDAINAFCYHPDDDEGRDCTLYQGA